MTDENDVIRSILTGDTSGANGDDAALLSIPGGQVAVTTDAMIMGMHALGCMSAEQFGARAVARAISDLAAMAVVPAGIVVALVVPETGWPLATRVLAGARDQALARETHLVGGDLTSGPDWMAVVTCLGARGATRPITRAGMQAGDELWVTGTLGGSARALDQLRTLEAARTTPPLSGTDLTAPDLAPYLMPPNRLRVARALAPWARAMIDISDGIARDAALLATSSGVGAQISLDVLPLASPLDAHTRSDAIRGATHGDDYELCLAIRPHDVSQAQESLARACPEIRLTKFGVAADGGQGVVFTFQGERVTGLTGHVHH